FERNRDFFALYAGDASIKARPSREAGTFAIDLKKGEILGDPSYYEKKGMTEAHAFNSFLHEFEHFRRLMGLVREHEGLAAWRAHRARMVAKPRLHVFDNVLEDISVDRTILARAPNQKETQFDLYRNHLWKQRDMTELPEHLQFVYALFREQMMPDEPVEVSEGVRAEIDALRKTKNRAGQDVVDVMSHPDMPQSKRLALQERFFEPVYERLFREDVRKKKEEKETQKGQGGQEGEGAPEQGQSPLDGEPSAGTMPSEQPEEPQSGKPKPGEEPSQPGLPEDPEKLFEDLYKEYLENSPDAALTDEQILEAVDAVIKPGKPKTPEELTEEAYAKEVGVSVEDLRAYQRFWETVEELRSPEADESVVEQIRRVFRKIVTERLEMRPRSRQPVEEGEYLIRPAEAVAESRAGHTDPAVWMTYEPREELKELFGAFDVTLVCDRSGSMNETDGTAVKNVEQQKAVALTLEALREFCDDLDDARSDLLADLHVRSEVWGFGGPPEVGCLKALSEELTDRQRVAVFKELASTPGKSTRDDLALD
ncbi:MAG: proline-rich domain-containing protein, partial [Patescibacteria group bacterium]